ncbi:hypothetical protein HWQ67_19575, partial [Candidatus Magnetobacterium casensis]|nr:hypothetical protein [Candidatus Magnetobacterium casensis]
DNWKTTEPQKEPIYYWCASCERYRDPDDVHGEYDDLFCDRCGQPVERVEPDPYDERI